VLASDVPLTAAMAREHYAIVDALGKLKPPEFDKVVRKTLGTFSQRWISSMSAKPSKNGNRTA